jgi:hypothetical protein
MKQPRLKAFGMEFFGRAQTNTGNLWWYEDKQEDGSIGRIPLVPIEPRIEPR